MATESERLVALETKVDIIIEQQKVLSEKLDKAMPNYVTHQQLSEKLTVLEQTFTTSRTSKAKDLAIQALIIGPISALIGFFIASITN